MPPILAANYEFSIETCPLPCQSFSPSRETLLNHQRWFTIDPFQTQQINQSESPLLSGHSINIHKGRSVKKCCDLKRTNQSMAYEITLTNLWSHDLKMAVASVNFLPPYSHFILFEPLLVILDIENHIFSESWEQALSNEQLYKCVLYYNTRIDIVQRWAIAKQ